MWTAEDSDNLDREIIRDRLYRRAREAEEHAYESGKGSGPDVRRMATPEHVNGLTEDILVYEKGYRGSSAERNRVWSYYKYRDTIVAVQPLQPRCGWCGVKFTPRRGHEDVMCSSACRSLSRKVEPESRVCEECFNPFSTAIPSQRFCSETCRRKPERRRAWMRKKRGGGPFAVRHG